MAGIKIPFLADVRDFLRGTRSVADGLDDVGDSLDDVARDARKTGDKVGDELKDGAKEAERSADKLERKFRDAFDDVKDESRTAGRKLGDNVKDGAKDAERAVEGFKDEARQNFAETASSFDGSMDSIADMAQSTLGGLATAIPGAGLALAGLGAAAGVFYQQWQDNAERTEQRIGEMYEDMLESGLEFLSEDLINQRLRDIYGKTEDAAVSWGRLQSIVKDTGLTQETVARAFAGDAEAQTEVLGRLEDAQQDLNDAIRDGAVAPNIGIQRARDLNSYEDALREVQRQQDAANGQARGYDAAVRQGMQGAAREIQRALPGLVPPPISIRAQATGWQAEVDRAARSLIPPSVAIKPFVQKAV